MALRGGIDDFRRIGKVAEGMRHLLAAWATSPLPRNATVVPMDESLDHINDVRQGFQLALRADKSPLDELQEILRQTLNHVDQQLLAALGFVIKDEIEPLGSQLMAFNHAAVSLNMLSHLPSSEVSHPTSHSYQDLSVPRGAGAWLERIEELERVLTDIQYARHQRLNHQSLRRTHAYFDASAWLVRQHLERFA
ncbi:MAG: hypothetical protein KDD73_07540 [Anaerolineales bacterium]|nr:hypothetical protein [Anaerolineales bacterium]MCB9128798.1 hypothetical protein [Ardenticatenales bacterium]MCB9171362.1 hypothetical protein [Ardenticatenales bacterium]